MVIKQAVQLPYFCITFLILGLVAFTASSQNTLLDQVTEGSEDMAPSSTADPAIPTVTSLEQQRTELKETLDSAQQSVREEAAQQLGISLEALQGRADRIRALDGLLQQQIGTLQRSAEMGASQQDLERDIATY